MTAVAEKKPEAATATRRKKFRFKVIYGMYVEGKGEDRVKYLAGKNDIIDTDFDLSKHNPKDKKGRVVPEMIKFAKVYEDGSTDYQGPLNAPRSEMDQRPDETDEDYAARLETVLLKVRKRKQDVNDRLDSLSRMSVAQLREFAAAEEIDLSGETKKDEILKILHDALGKRK